LLALVAGVRKNGSHSSHILPAMAFDYVFVNATCQAASVFVRRSSLDRWRRTIFHWWLISRGRVSAWAVWWWDRLKAPSTPQGRGPGFQNRRCLFSCCIGQRI